MLASTTVVRVCTYTVHYSTGTSICNTRSTVRTLLYITITSIILYILDLMKRLFATTLRTHFSLIILITTFDLFVPRLVHQQL